MPRFRDISLPPAVRRRPPKETRSDPPMSHRRDDVDDADPDDFDPSWDDESDADDDPTMPCPSCGADVYDDAVRCPVCERYLSDEERMTTSQRPWIIVTALVLLVAFLWACLR